MTSTPEPVKGKIPSPAEILEWIGELARDGDGADRRFALKLLSAQGSTGNVLPEPLSAEDIEKRMTMLMRAAGRDMSKICYAKAFKFRRVEDIETDVPDLDTADIKEFVDVKKLPHTLKQLHRRFPEMKTRGGYPKGYPAGKGPLLQRDWVRKYAIRILRDKHTKQLQADAEALKNHKDVNATETDTGQGIQPDSPGENQEPR